MQHCTYKMHRNHFFPLYLSRISSSRQTIETRSSSSRQKTLRERARTTAKKKENCCVFKYSFLRYSFIFIGSSCCIWQQNGCIWLNNGHATNFSRVWTKYYSTPFFVSICHKYRCCTLQVVAAAAVATCGIQKYRYERIEIIVQQLIQAGEQLSSSIIVYVNLHHECISYLVISVLMHAN